MKTFLKENWYHFAVWAVVLGSVLFFILDFSSIKESLTYYRLFFYLVVPIYTLFAGNYLIFFLWMGDYADTIKGINITLVVIIAIYMLIAGNSFIKSKGIIAKFEKISAETIESGKESHERALKLFDEKSKVGYGETFHTLKDMGYYGDKVPAWASGSGYFKSLYSLLSGGGYGDFKFEALGEKDASYMWVVIDGNFTTYSINKYPQWLAAKPGQKVVKKWVVTIEYDQVKTFKNFKGWNFEDWENKYVVAKDNVLYYKNYKVVEGWVYFPVFK